ncbi:MAG: PKD domain-containing protein [Bacteroidota bacterium]|nr:PKD domain-containing protein [Bacteroidota bacterium]
MLIKYKYRIAFLFLSIFVLINFNYAQSVYNSSTFLKAYDIQADSLVLQSQQQITNSYGVDVDVHVASKTLFVTKEGSNKIKIFDAVTMTELGSVKAPQASNLAGITINQQTGIVYSVQRKSNKLYIYLWDSVNDSLILQGSSYVTLPSCNFAYGLEFDRTTSRLYVGDRGNGIKYYNINNLSVLAGQISTTNDAIDIAINEQNQCLYFTSGSPSGSAYLSKYELATNTESTTNVGSTTLGVAVNQLTGFVYVSTYYGGSNGQRLLTYNQNLTKLWTSATVGFTTGLAVANIGYNPLELYVKNNIGSACIVPEGKITYSIKYQNQLNFDTISDVNIIATLADSFIFISASDSGIYDSSSKTVKWNIGSLLPHTFTDSFTLVVKLSSAFPQYSTVLLSSVIDGNPIGPTTVTDYLDIYYCDTLLSIGSDTTICPGDSVILNAYGYGFENYLWQDSSSNHEIYADTPGIYWAEVATGFGTTLRDSVVISNHPLPNVDFDILDSIQCLSANDFYFSNNSSIASGSINFFFWDFGDGDSLIFDSANHSYNYYDTFLVKLYATSNYGCIDSASKNTYVDPMPIADFYVDDNLQCFTGNNFVFTDSSKIIDGSIDSLYFSMGDSSYYYSSDTNHTYQNYGQYSVTQIVISSKGCIDTLSKNIFVSAMPEAEIYVNDYSQCLSSNNFIFMDSSSVTNDSISVVSWNFGDNTTSNSKNPNHAYSTFDTFNIKLKVSSTNACSDSTFTTVNVSPMPKSNFSINDTDQCFNENLFLFYDSSTMTASSSGLTYQWNFGDSNISDSQNTSHVYSNYGTFNVKLTVTSDKGCKDSMTKTVIVYPNPDIYFSINDSSQCFAQNNFYFSNNSTINSGSLASYYWTFGDDSFSNSKNAQHTYYSNNTFSVKLKVTSGGGCNDSLTKNVYVNPMPIAGFSVNDSIQCFNENLFAFTNSSSLSSGSLNYIWHFGTGDTSSSSNPNYIYSLADTFSVKLSATTNFGCADSTIKTVYISPSPIVDFNVNDSTQCFNKNNFVFTNNSTISSGSQSFLWDFDDGNYSTSTSPAYVFQSFDTFNIKVVSTSNLGCNDSLTKPVFVFPSPNTNFSINDSQQCLLGNSFNFNNLSTINSGSLNYLWFLNDSLKSTNKHFNNLIIEIPDTYQIKLVTYSNNGCFDTLTKNIYVHPSPILKFLINDTSQCFDNNYFIFNNKSSISSGSSNYIWDFGDGGSSTNISPSHSYNSPDTFGVKLIGISNLGCKDSLTRKTYIHVHPVPIADFSINDSGQCLTVNLFKFFDNSAISSGSMFYNWSFGDSSFSTLKNPTHSYNYFDTINVKLLTVSDFGCKDSITKNVIVFPMPVAGFKINNTTQCLSKNTFLFSDSSSIIHGSIDSFCWNVGDGTNYSGKNISHKYLQSDTFFVKHLIFSSFGCKDSIIKNIITYPMPTVDFSINDSTQCLSANRFEFYNSSFLSGYQPLDKLHFKWNLGDLSNTVNTVDAVHSYLNYNTFNVKLVATSTQNCIDSITKNIIVYPMPKANFSVNDSIQCFAENNFKFSNLSTIDQSNALTYFWDFGDNNTSTVDEPAFSFTKYGTFTVKLLATSFFNCKDSIFKDVKIAPTPLANFSINDTSQCLKNNNFIFSNKSTISEGNLSYIWDFGNIDTSTQTSPHYSYDSNNSYIVKLIVLSNQNCSDTLELYVVVHPMPKANFDYEKPCLNDSFSFFDKTTIYPPDNISSWYWTFHNGNSSTFQNPVHINSMSGNYPVTLFVRSNNGCENEITKYLFFNKQVIANKIERATVIDDKKILIEWTENLIGNPMMFRLERSSDNFNYKFIGNFEMNILNYIDKFVSVDDSSYVYRIQIIDSCLYKCSYSNIAKTILLTVDSTKEFSVLNWTPYLDWEDGVSEYEVQIFDENFNQFITIDNQQPSTPNNLKYIDNQSKLNQEEYCYRIVAKRNGDELESMSNVVCLPTQFNLWMPNSFSPNRDGLNDIFEIKGTFILDFNIKIFNRWGEKLFESNDVKNCWDGNYNGSACQTGVYYYQLYAKGTNGKKISHYGTITLLK